MPSSDNRSSFFPRVESPIHHSASQLPAPPSTHSSAPSDQNAEKSALEVWSAEAIESMYPVASELWDPAPIPTKPEGRTGLYLAPFLTQNERLRLTLLSYYTKGALEDFQLLSLLEGKIQMAYETVGWESVAISFVTNNTFTQVVARGLSLPNLVRRESLCAHTINQKPGALFILSDISKDWRFSGLPQVKHLGLRAYAGVPLSFETESGEHVAFGSLFIASRTTEGPLSKKIQLFLIHLAHWIVNDILYSARIRREKEWRQMQLLLGQVQDRCAREDDGMEDIVVNVLQKHYPRSIVRLQISEHQQIELEQGVTILTSELKHGLWEDDEHIERLIIASNHQDMVASRIIRIAAARCENANPPSFLFIGTMECSVVFDDVNAWFVSACAALLCRYWQSRALKVALAARETFLRGITHQLRTPIHGILGFAQLISEDLRSQGQGEIDAGDSSGIWRTSRSNLLKIVDSIRISAKDLFSIVDDLITISRCTDQNGIKRSIDLHQVNAIEFILKHNVEQIMPENVSKRPSIMLSHRLPQNCDSLVLDIGLFVSSVLPLIKNAIQHTPGGIIAVTISITDDFQSMRVDIEDNGEGIKKSRHKTIFERHDEAVGEQDRAGLGFILCRRLSALMDGTISLVSSQTSKGTHFSAVYRHPVSACSVKARSPCHKMSRITPCHFQMSQISSTVPSIDKYFLAFLIGLGYFLSSKECSLVILSFASTAADMSDQAARVKAMQVGICLTSEAGFLSKFDEGYVRRDGNVVYVRSPFVSSTLEQALCDATEALMEISSTANHVDVREDPSQKGLKKTEKPEKNASCAGLECSEQDQSVANDKVEHKVLKSTVSPPVLQSRHIMALLVDDNAINLRLLQTFCDRRGISYKTARGGEEAVQYFSQYGSPAIEISPSPHALHPSPSPTNDHEDPKVNEKSKMKHFDLVFMDFQMPQCNGIEATRRIRALEQSNHWPKSIICIISAQGYEGDMELARQAGADDYLVKPVSPKALASWIKDRFPQADF